MACSLDKKGQSRGISLYFVFFGLAFIICSTIYLVNLNKFDNSHCVPLLAGALTYTDTDITTSCDKLFWWRRLSIIGIVYGVLWLFAAPITQLFPFLCGNDSRKKDESQNGPPYVIMEGQGDSKAMTDAAHYFVKLQEKQRQNRANTLLSSCFKSIESTARFIVTLGFWLGPLILPAYLVVNLVRAGAIRANREEDSLYFPALALSITCALNILIVVVGCVFLSSQKPSEDEEEESERRRRTWMPRFAYLNEKRNPQVNKFDPIPGPSDNPWTNSTPRFESQKRKEGGELNVVDLDS